MRVAFKEWAIVVDALGRGEQIVILRKGGISEGRKGFDIDYPRFLLFPTLFHQQRESVFPQAQPRFEEIISRFLNSDRLQIEFFAEIAAWKRLNSLADAERLRGQHIWQDEVIAQRFDWGKAKNIHALAVRVFRLPHVIELPMLSHYGGCKSWVELEKDISTEGAAAVLNEPAFARKLAMFGNALELTPAALSPALKNVGDSTGQHC